ncbi:MAG: dTMP kinase [Candidatus Methylomirabilota bacterium]|nr:dTMP kinase [Candidatus Methylomirabilis sp.]NJD67706.1 dTMP kinase [candidate division NC10 bacterium]PWB47964.1 MAG: dTMP kinase [candidate division NC10 bacterium]
MRGLFVTFEGGEGSGKTTQLALLADRVRASGQEVVETHDPGGTAIGKEIRSLLLHLGSGPIAPATELLLYEASRAQLVRELIAPAIGREAVVLCDRFTDSTVAYQGFGRGIDLDLIRRLNRFATDGLAPDLTILLDLDPQVGLARCRQVDTPEKPIGLGAASLSWDRIEAEPLDFHRRVRDGYLTLAAENADRVIVIDAGLDAIEIEAIVWNRFIRLTSVQRCRFMMS